MTTLPTTATDMFGAVDLDRRDACRAERARYIAALGLTHLATINANGVEIQQYGYRPTVYGDDRRVLIVVSRDGSWRPLIDLPRPLEPPRDLTAYRAEMTLALAKVRP